MKKRMLTGSVLAILVLVIVPGGIADSPGEPPDGGKFKLSGTTKDDVDPANSFNEVISTWIQDEAPGPALFGAAMRKLGDHVKVPWLDNQLEMKAWFAPSRSCGGGAPRIQLAISTDGDNEPEGNAFGYFGPSPSFTGCPSGEWIYEDLTDGELEWDLTQFGGLFYNTWEDVETFFAAYPNHKVVRGGLADDTFAGSGAGEGCAYYDLMSVGARTYTDHADTSGHGDGPNPC